MPSETSTCSACDRFYSDVPQSYGPKAPLPWHLSPEAERQRACKLTEDTVVLFNEDFLLSRMDTLE